MTTTDITKTTTGLITTAGSTAHKVIAAYRQGGKQLQSAAQKRWNSAFKQSSPELSAETRRNATHAQKVFSGYYSKGLALSADGATTVVDTLVGAALTVVRKAS